MSLAPDQYCLFRGGQPQCRSVSDNNQGPGTLSMQIEGDSSGVLCIPVYVRPGKPARMTVQQAGVRRGRKRKW